MRPAALAFSRPASLDEAAALLREGGVPLAGGQALIAQLTRREVAVDRVVDLAGIPGLRAVRVLPDGSLHLGAMVTIATLEDDPLVSRGWPLLRWCSRNRSTASAA